MRESEKENGTPSFDSMFDTNKKYGIHLGKCGKKMYQKRKKIVNSFDV